MRPHLHNKQARKDGIEMKTGEMNINMPVVPKTREHRLHLKNLFLLVSTFIDSSPESERRRLSALLDQNLAASWSTNTSEQSQSRQTQFFICILLLTKDQTGVFEKNVTH